MPIMTAQNCDEFLERSDSADLLESVLERSLFVTASSGTPRTYEFHPMFRDLLLETLRASDFERFRSLRNRGAGLLQKSAPEIAVDIYLEDGEDAQAAEVMEERAAWMFRNGRVVTIETWIEALPSPARYAPRLTFEWGRVLYDKGAVQSARDYFVELSDDLGVPDDIRMMAKIYVAMTALELGEAKNALTILGSLDTSNRSAMTKALALRLEARYLTRERQDYEGACELNSRAIDILEAASDPKLLVVTLQYQATLLGRMGRLSQARKVTERGLQIAEDVGAPLAIALSQNDMGQLSFLSGDFEDALDHFQLAVSAARKAASPSRESLMLLGFAEVFADLGLNLQSADLLGEMLDIATRIDHADLISLGCIGTSILHRRALGFRLANEWLARAGNLDVTPHQRMLEIQRGALLSHSNPDKAADRLWVIVNNAEGLSSQELTLGWYFYSVSLKRSNRVEDARNAFRRCMDVVSLHGSEQYVAGELAIDPEMLAWSTEVFANDPTLLILGDRVDRMSTVRRHFVAEENLQPSRSGVLITALGATIVSKAGGIIDGLKPQALEVLVYLVDRGRVERDRIVEEFWYEYPPGRQSANLHMAIYAIRRALGKDTINLNGSVYEVASSTDVRYDVSEFERAAEIVRTMPTGDPRRLFALTEATSKYAGQFMPEYFTNWVDARRKELEGLFLDMSANLAEEAIRKGQPQRAIEPLRSALALDPFRDDLNMKYLEALESLERRSEILSHYQGYAQLIRDELGLEPSEGIRKLHDRVVKGGL
jgi:DNA-binding SARP family transcriptional activator